MQIRVSFIILFLLPLFGFSQVKSVSELNQNFVNWYHKNLIDDKVPGVAVSKAYKELLKDKKAQKTIIVAVIDSGVDPEHEDLKENIWINEDEIPSNNIDDDKNGYIDDIHGWNFLGNSKGENIAFETYEYTRIYKLKDPSNPLYNKAKELYEKEYAEKKKDQENIAIFEKNYQLALTIIKSKTGVEVKSIDDLGKVFSDDQQVMGAKNYLYNKYKQGFTEKSLERLKENTDLFLNYHLNMDYNPRTITGDNPDIIDNVVYGNPDVKGAKSDHGTSVAGVIAAVRNNSIGIDGIANNVKIMCIRSTPKGDERDKDVALAIRYAVDNGAHIINMSFGKQVSPQKKLVDEAVKLAEQKGVLIVHAAGNYGFNIDIDETYPSDRYADGSEPKNWINVGSTGIENTTTFASIFSNYGKQHVDIFAPGEKIVSLNPNNQYDVTAGTSLSAPIVSGIAALILSYYPTLNPEDVIRILMESSDKTIVKKVLIPDLANSKRKKIKFSELSKSGGVVNVYNALIMAESYKR